MKCIRCNHDSKYPERPSKRCPNCKGEFAFEPRENDLLTDAAFLNAIEAVSSHRSVRWLVDNLYYEICRRKKSFVAPVPLIVVLIVAMFVTVVLAGAVHPAWLVGMAVAGVGAVAAVLNRMYPNQFVNVDRATFNKMWERWCQVHSRPDSVIVRQPQPKKSQPVEKDIGDYSFDRAVICDRDTAVDLLVANNFHFENNCAVLSIDGYPPGPFETVRAMLKRNPKLEVFALHDASVKGCLLAHKLSTDPAWFAGGVKVVDVGLRPMHAKPFGGLYQHSKESYFPEGAALTAEEAEWLTQYTLELAVIRPEQVLKRLYRAINKKPAPGDEGGSDGDGFIFISSGDGGSFPVDRESFSSDAGAADDGGVDGFG